VGGESARGDRPAVSAAEEIARVEELVAALVKDDVLTSIDTYKYDVAAAAISAGASIVNDVSGLRDERLASLCASTGTALVVMHTAIEPKGTLLDPATYDDAPSEVLAFLQSRIDVALAAGVEFEQLIVDPGPDFAKTPAQTVAVLRRMDLLRELGRPILLAASRKDFVGAITGRAPAERDAGTLAALGWGADEGASILRVHDVAGASDYFSVRSVLRGERVLDSLEGLTPERYPDGVPDHLSLG
jgi:dihydropteroate synthase